MKTSLTDFNKEFLLVLISFLWKQWEKVGVAIWSHESVSWEWLIDPEALVFATYLLRDEDQRLFHVMQIWLGAYPRFFHPARFKRIWRQYMIYAGQMKIPVPEQYEIGGRAFRLASKRAMEILTTPDWENPSLLWLKLRAFLGAGVRSDTLIYLLYRNIGTSFSISREMFIDQKSIHEVLRVWESVGWVQRFGQKRGYVISPIFRNHLQTALGFAKLPPQFNTSKAFIGMFLVRGVIQRFFKHQDSYLLSSQLRDILPLLREIWECTGMQLPNPLSYPGEAYIPVFLKSLLEVSSKLEQSGRLQQVEFSRGEILQGLKEGGIFMSFTEHEMYESAYRVLRRRYPAHEGWEIIPQFEGSGYRPDFVIERKDWWGRVHRVVAEVKASCAVTQNDVRQLKAYSKAVAGGNVVIDEKILIVPAGANTSVVPDDITVIHLRSFRC